MTAPTLEISETLLAQIASAAAQARSRECCGLIEGVREAGGWRAMALHPMANTAEHAEREFLIDPAEQFRLLHRLRGTSRDVIGCYHSHPDGIPAPSQADRAGAGEDGFLWLIAGGDGTIGAFVFRAKDEKFHPVTIERRSP